VGKKAKWVAAIALLSLVSAACGSSSHSAGATGSANSGHTYTIGLLTDLTGLAAGSTRTSVEGAKAGIIVAKQKGYNIKLDVADTATSPAGALTAAQNLVDQDHVLAVIADSVLTFAAAHFLTSRGIPVIGWPSDGTEWLTSKNMFSDQGYQDTSKVATLFGKFLASQGVTNLGVVGYGVPATSAKSAHSYALSAQSAGIKIGYLNAKLPLGTTDVQPVALAMKSAGVNGVIAPVAANTALLLITALHQAGVDVKAGLLSTGYGSDLTNGGPGAIQSAQGVDFLVPYEPIEMHTAATQQFQQALSQVGVTTDPGYAEYSSYVAIAMLVAGLQGAGSHPTASSLIASLTNLHNFDAAGLLGSHSYDPGNRTPDATLVDNCAYIAKLVGSGFQLVPGADPVCGSVIPGVTASAS
jgi:ABC-type branched-subunit amino acid transport system substrate-binding protein